MSAYEKYEFLNNLGRAAGHTHAMLFGATNCRNVLVLTYSEREAKRLRKEYGVTSRTVGEAGSILQGGSRRPVVMDIEAVRLMRLDYEKAIRDEMRASNKQLKAALKQRDAQHAECQQRGLQEFLGEQCKSAQYAASMKQLAVELERAENRNEDLVTENQRLNRELHTSESKNWKHNQARVLAEAQQATLESQNKKLRAEVSYDKSRLIDKLEAARDEVLVLRKCLANRDDKIIGLEQEVVTLKQYMIAIEELASIAK